MANVYAIKTGNWSDVTVWNTGALPTSADDVFSNNFTVTIDQNVTVLTIRNSSATGITAGGSFRIVLSGISLVCTNNHTTAMFGASNVLQVSHSSGNVNITFSHIRGVSYSGQVTIATILGTGTTNWTGTVESSISNNSTIFVANGVLNFVGDIVLNPYSGSGSIVINASANVVINMTGNIYLNPNYTVGSTVYGIFANNGATLNITGNVSNSLLAIANHGGVVSNAGMATINITGTITGSNYTAVSISTNSYFKHIGTCISSGSANAIVSSSAAAINIFSGPFMCSNYGFFPYQVVRMHLIPTTNSYFEFRDETTNGAVSPSAVAPATQLVSPATLVDNLAVSDVRFGTTYALGTLTGTLRMPTANQVTFGIPVDNTFGNAVLTAASVWDYLISNITVENSIGMRLKNVSTPQITGEQLEAFLRLD
jgi:hypothetical protein